MMIIIREILFQMESNYFPICCCENGRVLNTKANNDLCVSNRSRTAKAVSRRSHLKYLGAMLNMFAPHKLKYNSIIYITCLNNWGTQIIFSFGSIISITVLSCPSVNPVDATSWLRTQIKRQTMRQHMWLKLLRSIGFYRLKHTRLDS